MDIQELVNSKLFRVIETEGRSTLVLKAPVRIVVPQSILSELAALYPKNHETGGFLYAEPNPTTGTLTIKQVIEIANQSKTDTTYAPYTSDYNRAIMRAVSSGLLPMRFHSHPVTTVNNLYNGQSLNFFQKTSSADRHNSYLPVYVGSQAVVMPDCLVSPNDRDGKTIRFSIYNGFVAPNSFAALLPNEQIFIGLVGVLLLIVASLWGWKRALGGLVACVVVGLFIFTTEKRPTYDYSDKGLLITI